MPRGMASASVHRKSAANSSQAHGSKAGRGCTNPANARAAISSKALIAAVVERRVAVMTLTAGSKRVIIFASSPPDQFVGFLLPAKIGQALSFRKEEVVSYMSTSDRPCAGASLFK